MTSQVAVSNFYGVAVASDTVSSRNTKGGMKTVTHTNKIYEIGKEHKLLVLHAGNSVTNGVPTWLLVTEWSKTLNAPLETVQDYIDSFLRWNSESAPLHTKESEQEYLNYRLNNHFSELNQATSAEIQALEEAKDANSAPINPRQVLLDKIELNTTWLKNQNKLDHFTLEQAESVIKNFTGDMSSKIKYWFEKFGVDKKDHVLLEKSAAHAIQTVDYLDDDDSYLAFVGFGSTQSFPVNRQLQLRGFYDGELRLIQRTMFDYSPSESWTPGIDFFAQRKAILGFIQGYHPDTLDQIADFVKQSMLEKMGAAATPELADQVVADFVDKTSTYAFTNFIKPLFNEVEGMTMSRLAEFAESLVGLQATAAKTLDDGPATVGGYIEVATIDKADGVRWVKSLDPRKIS